MKNRYLFVSMLSLLLIPGIALCQFDSRMARRGLNPDKVLGIKGKYHLDPKDTSLQMQENYFLDAVDRAGTIVDAQVVSMKSQMDSVRHVIYTAIKFKVIHMIKGDFNGTGFTYDQVGGTVGRRSAWLSGQPIYWLGERAIFFFMNKNIDKYILLQRMYQVFTTPDGSRSVVDFSGMSYPHNVDLTGFINMIKQSLTDTAACTNYLHRMVRGEEKPTLSVPRRKGTERQGKSDTIQGGVR